MTINVDPKTKVPIEEIGTFIRLKGRSLMIKKVDSLNCCRLCALGKNEISGCPELGYYYESVCLRHGEPDMVVLVAPHELTEENVRLHWAANSFISYKGVAAIVADSYKLEEANIIPSCINCLFDGANQSPDGCPFHCMSHERPDKREVVPVPIHILAGQGVVRELIIPDFANDDPETIEALKKANGYDKIN